MGGGQGKGWGLSLSLSSTSHPPLSSWNIWSFLNSTTFNQNHKQSWEELCHLMNTVQVDPDCFGLDLLVICWRMTLNTHINYCCPVEESLYCCVQCWMTDKNKTTTDRMTTKQVAIYVLHWKYYWYNDYSILYVRGASDQLTNWLVNCSVSWPNRKPAVPFCHWFLPPMSCPKRRS